MEYIVGLVLGVLASVVAWIISVKTIVPQIKFSNTISRMHASYQEMPRYHFFVKNQGLRDVFDISIFFRISIMGLMADFPDVYENVNVTVGASDGHIVRVKAKERIRLAISPHKCPRFSELYFPEWVREKYDNGSLTLDDIFSLGTHVKACFIAYGYDKWSGARKYFESDVYTCESIIDETETPQKPVKTIIVKPFAESQWDGSGGGGGEEE